MGIFSIARSVKSKVSSYIASKRSTPSSTSPTNTITSTPAPTPSTSPHATTAGSPNITSRPANNNNIVNTGGQSSGGGQSSTPSTSPHANNAGSPNITSRPANNTNMVRSSGGGSGGQSSTPSTSPHATTVGSPNITSRPASDIPANMSSLTDDYNRTNERLSERIPTRSEISQKGADFRDEHPGAANALYTTFESAGEIGERVIPDDVRTVVQNQGGGGYDDFQADPLKAGLMGALMLPFGAALRTAGAISKATGVTGAVQSIPLIGGGVAKYGAGALIGGVYAVDINERVNEPVFTGYNQTVETNATHIITTDTPTYRDPTLAEQAYRFGGITSTEILPMVVGAGVYGKLTTKKNVVVTEEVIVDPVRKFEVIEGIKQTTTKTAGSSRTTTKINTEIVPEGNIRSSEIRRFEKDILGKSERTLEIDYTYSKSAEGVTHSSQATGPVTLKKKNILAEQSTFSESTTADERMAMEWLSKRGYGVGDEGAVETAIRPILKRMGVDPNKVQFEIRSNEWFKEWFKESGSPKERGLATQNKDGSGTITLRESSPSKDSFDVISHEIGHVVEKEGFSNIVKVSESAAKQFSSKFGKVAEDVYGVDTWRSNTPVGKDSKFTLSGQRNTYIKESDWRVSVDPAKPTDPVRPIETFGTKRTTHSELDLVLREKVKEPEFFRPDMEMEILHFRGRPRGEIVKDTTSNLGDGQQLLNDYSFRVKSDVRHRDMMGGPIKLGGDTKAFRAMQEIKFGKGSSNQPNTVDPAIKTNFGTGKQSGQLDNIMHSNSGSGVGMDASLGPMQQGRSPQPILQPTLKRNTGITAEQIMGELPATQQVITSQHTVQIPGQKFTPIPMQTDPLGSRQVHSVISNIQPIQSNVMGQTPIMDFMKPPKQKQSPIFGVRLSSARTMFDQRPVQGQKPIFAIKQEPIQGHPPIMDSILKTGRTPMFAEQSVLDIGRIGGARYTHPAPPIPVVALPPSGGLGGMGGRGGGDWDLWGSRKKRHDVKDPLDFLMG